MFMGAWELDFTSLAVNHEKNSAFSCPSNNPCKSYSQSRSRTTSGDIAAAEHWLSQGCVGKQLDLHHADTAACDRDWSSPQLCKPGLSEKLRTFDFPLTCCRCTSLCWTLLNSAELIWGSAVCSSSRLENQSFSGQSLIWLKKKERKKKKRREKENKRTCCHRIVSMNFLAVIIITSIALCLKFRYVLLWHWFT